MNESNAESTPPLDSDTVMRRARAISSDSLVRVISYTNRGDERGSTSFTQPNGQIVKVERDGTEYMMQPLDKDGNVIENVYVSTKPKLDVDA